VSPTFITPSGLISAIKEYMENNNQNPQVFVWSAPAKQILTKIAIYKEALAALL